MLGNKPALNLCNTDGIHCFMRSWFLVQKFVNAVITGVDFTNAILTGADFEDALVGGEDVKRLCANATLVEDSRYQVGCRQN